MKFGRRNFLKGVPAIVGAAGVSSTIGSAAARSLINRTMVFMTADALSDVDRGRHERHMATALGLAERSDGPFGAVIVDRQTDKVVCAGENRFSENRILHAVIDALNNCATLDPKPQGDGSRSM